MLDEKLHTITDTKFDEKALEEVNKQCHQEVFGEFLPYNEQFSWYNQVNHLVAYPGMYFTYALGPAVASNLSHLAQMAATTDHHDVIFSGISRLLRNGHDSDFISRQFKYELSQI
jgi:hypothetical protein